MCPPHALLTPEAPQSSTSTCNRQIVSQLAAGLPHSKFTQGRKLSHSSRELQQLMWTWHEEAAYCAACPTADVHPCR